MSYKWVTTATIGCGVIFQAGAPFDTGNAEFWLLLAILSQIDALFGGPFTGLDNIVVPQNWQPMIDNQCLLSENRQISGMADE